VPLKSPTQSGWDWITVDVQPSCRACDGSRGYLTWASSGTHNTCPYWASPTDGGGLVTLELRPHLRAYDSELEPEWEAPVTLPPNAGVSRRLRAGAAGSYYAAGWLEQPQISSWFAKFASEGELVWERVLATGWIGLDAMPLDDAGVVVLSSSDKNASGTYSASLRKLTADGIDVWDVTIPDVRPILRTGFRLESVGETDMVVGYMSRDAQQPGSGSDPSAASFAVASRFTADGTLVWTRRLSRELHSAEMGRVARLDSSRLVFAGIQYPTLGPWPSYAVTLWFVGGLGTLEREAAVDARDGEYFLVSSVSVVADGGVLVGGSLTQYSGVEFRPLSVSDSENWRTDSFLMKTDGRGNFEWLRLYGGPGVDLLSDVATSAEGRITAVGQWGIENASAVRNWILRTDFWGRTCGMRLGVCADKSWQDCEDGNPCTINWCDPDEGCTAPPLPDGSPCGDGLTCQGAVCK
jgi:hypothetical protein